MKLIRIFTLFLLLGCLSTFAFCKKAPSENQPEITVTLDQTKAIMYPGQKRLVKPNFGAGVTPQRNYTWTSANPAVADISLQENNIVEVIAKTVGTTEITFASSDGKVSAQCKVVVEATPDDGVLKILAIGNSFSEDAVEAYLHDLIRAEGKPVVVGNAVIGGAPLSLHVDHSKNNAAAYSYRKIDQSGNKSTTPNMTLADAITDEDWDYISLQQVSHDAGKFSTFQASLPALYSYVQSKATNYSVKYILHQTWAYAQNSTHSGFAYYNNDQMTMYNAVVDAVDQAKSLADFTFVAPAGTAIQNARTSYIGDNFCRDGYHLDLNIGRYTAACAWFETIMGKSVIGNSFKPAALSDFEAALAQTAAHLAVQNPKTVTELVDFKEPQTAKFTKPVYVAFGPGAVVPGWNRLASPLAGTTLANMKDTDGNATPVSLTVTERFNAHNTVGEATTSTDFNMPSAVSTVNFYGNTKSFNGIVATQSQVTLTGLDKTKKYNLCYFGSRGSVTDNRETAYTATGKNTATVYLNVTKNTNKTVCTENIQPNDNGEITVTMTVGPNNNNSTGFFHITALRVVPAS